MARTIEVDWEVEHTTIVVIEDDGTLSFGSDSTPGPVLGRITDPEGGEPNVNDEDFRDDVLDFICNEVA